MKGSGRSLFLRVTAVIGLLVFAFLIWRIGPGVIWKELRKLDAWTIALLFGMRAGYLLFRTWIWRTVYARYDAPPPFGHLFAARIAGHAVSYLTPSAYVGGEAVRALMIEGRDRKPVLASVIVDTTFGVLGVGALAGLGVIALVAASPLPFSGRAALAASFAASALVLGLLVRKQRSGFFGWLAGIPARIGLRPRFIERNRERIRRVDEHIADFYVRGDGGPLQVFALYMLLNAFWIMEIFVTLRALGAPGLTIGKSVLVGAFGAVGLIVPTTPASLGTYEATNLAVFAGLGWGAGLGMSMILVRRALSLFWAGVGLFIIARKHIRLRPVPETPGENEEGSPLRASDKVLDRPE